MSLTANDITAKNFQTFYEGIRPYLNGSFPTPIVNKFSKGDLYSTDEKIIGQWIDGKPLYQKTFVFDSDITVSGTTRIPVKHTDYDMDYVLCGIAYYLGGSSSSSNFCFYAAIIAENDNQNIGVISPIGNTKMNAITIAYTKTTDSPIAIGSDTDYSTTEKIVGTWIDGKPLYQKTIDCGALPNTAIKTVAHSISGWSKTVNVYGYSTNGSNCIPVQYNSAGNADISVYTDATYIGIKTMSDVSSYSETYITIQYTKTTD